MYMYRLYIILMRTITYIYKMTNVHNYFDNY